VEAVLHDHPAVADAAVLGVPDERLGRGRHRVVVADGVGEAELVEWCRARLARFKVPKSFRFIGEIPRNGMGKVQKQELRASEVAS
jgi:Acyl-CoA synthetases (AMP-forming)/AMP-acid ligases II